MFKSIRLLVLPLLLLIAGAGAVHAHAVVVGAHPPDGVVLANAPSEVIVRFNEPVSLVRAQVLDPSGRNVLVADGTRSDGGDLLLVLPSSMVEGTYTVSYHVMSIDGHPIAGSMIFSVGKISGQESGEPAMRGPGEQAVNAPYVWQFVFLAVRVALYIGMFGAVGGVVLLVVAKPSDQLRHATRRIIAVSSVTGVFAALIGLGLQGGMLLGGPPGFLLDGNTWLTGARSPFGRTAISAIVGLALILVAVRTARPAKTLGISAAGSVLILASFALSGHVVTGGPPELTIPPLLLHVAVAAFWVGSLLPLLRALTTPEASLTLNRFSRVAVIAVPVMVLAGAVLAALQVRDPDALLTTEYGLILIVKLVLVTALLGLAVQNRVKFAPALARGDAGVSRRLSRSIQAEIGTVVAILFATAALGTTPPPRALLSGSQANLLSGRTVDAAVALLPGRIGANQADIAVQNSDGRPLEVVEITLWVSNPELGVAPLQRPAQRLQAGRWRVSDLVLALPGSWHFEVDVLISDFAGETLEGRFKVEEISTE